MRIINTLHKNSLSKKGKNTGAGRYIVFEMNFQKVKRLKKTESCFGR